MKYAYKYNRLINIHEYVKMIKFHGGKHEKNSEKNRHLQISIENDESKILLHIID